MSITAIGPAVGARGQIGFSQEGRWGKKQPTPTNFIEMVTESVVSELGVLTSNSLRADRAVHKSIRGVESAGGDVNIEIVAEGLGTVFKHALGSVVTTRQDAAFIVNAVGEGGTVTTAEITVTVAAGLATRLEIDINDGTGVDLDLTEDANNTIGKVMALINAPGTGLKAYSPVSYMAGGDATTLQADDYSVGTDNSNRLGALDAVEFVGGPNEDNAFFVPLGFGVYEHVIDAAPKLPEGLTLEIGRDIAAFTYSGAKVNSLALNAETGEIFTGTVNVMAAGATTVSRAIPHTGNTGNEKNAFSIRYLGEGATCELDINKTDHQLIIDSATAAEDLIIDLSIPYIDPDTGKLYAVNTIGGLVDFLNNLDYMWCRIADYAELGASSVYLKELSTEDIKTVAPVVVNFDDSDMPSEPVTWGDYVGTDEGTSKEFIAEIVAGGAPGTATIKFNAVGEAAGATVTTSAAFPTEVRIADNANTGFTIFFPDDTALVAGDKWTISTFRLATEAAYSELDPFAGFSGFLTIDGDRQPIMGWNCTLNNNLFGEKYDLGARVRAALPEQRRNCEGTMRVEFDNLDLYRRFVNNIEGNLTLVFIHDDYISTSALGISRSNYSMIVRQPKIRYDGSTPVIDDEGIIETEFPYTSLYDAANGVPDLRITLVNNIAVI